MPYSLKLKIWFKIQVSEVDTNVEPNNLQGSFHSNDSSPWGNYKPRGNFDIFIGIMSW